MRQVEELRDAVEAYLESLTFAPELGALEPVLRYSLESKGKRIRPVLCLAVVEAAGGDVEHGLPAAAALELVHTFSLVHDDLPALDDDAEGVALLAGDALLVEALRLALSYDNPGIARELVDATLGMIGGQYLDITGGGDDLARLHRLKTGRLLAASVGLGLRAADLPEAEWAPWRAFGEELGLLFQVVDDILDADGFAAKVGVEGARELADDAADRALGRLAALRADTSVLRELVDYLAVRIG